MQFSICNQLCMNQFRTVILIGYIYNAFEEWYILKTYIELTMKDKFSYVSVIE